ncbi:hypothetical protein EGYY_16170 [Eggerthella sp. YY7918]|nr:hypothetical protein EGYY_16170 [Eggerthella sp. YY7918]
MLASPTPIRKDEGYANALLKSATLCKRSSTIPTKESTVEQMMKVRVSMRGEKMFLRPSARRVPTKPTERERR